VIDHVFRGANNNEFPPPLESFTKNLILKNVFNKDIEMSYDMLYRQEKLVSIGQTRIEPILATAK
jgi:hypothetical protein